MPIAPIYAETFRQQWPAFQKFLEANGYVIINPTNQYELARFRNDAGVTGIVYRNKKDMITSWEGCSGEAWERFTDSPKPDANPIPRVEADGEMPW